jgi:hypothetical protein
MRNEMVIPECNHRIDRENESECQCSHARFSYKGTFDKSFCVSCPIANKEEGISFAEKLARFTVASAKHIANGLKIVTEEEQIRRREICHGCDKFNREDQTCTNCGCFVPIKITWDSERCPLSKW